MDKQFLARNQTAIILFFTALVCYGYFFSKYSDPNENSRLNLVYSIAEDGTFRIDRYHENTIDKAYFLGHYYSDKAPGSSFLAVPVYAFIRLFSGIFSNSISTQTSKYLIRLFVVSMPSALLAVLIYQFLGYFNKNEYLRYILVLFYSLGTIAFTYSILFYGHQIVAFLIFLCFYLMFSIKQESVEDKAKLFLCGFLSGYACITEYPASIAVFFMAVYLFVSLKKKSNVLVFLLGSIMPVLLMMTYDYMCFGGIFRIGQSYPAIREFKQIHMNSFFGLTFPRPGVLLSLCFSISRGLFFLSPFLLLSIPGFYYFYKREKYRKEFWLFVCVVVYYFIYNSSYWDPIGGNGIGTRYLVPVLPFLAAPVIFCFDHKGKYSFRKTLEFLGVLSVILVSVVTITEPRVPMEINNALGAVSVPLLIRGYIIDNQGMILGLKGLSSLLPLFLILLLFFAIFKRNQRIMEIKPEEEVMQGKNRRVGLAGNIVFVSLAGLVLLAATVEKESVDVYNFMGLKYQKMGQFENALKNFNKAISINPKHPYAYSNILKMYVNNGKYDEAIKMGNEIIGLAIASGETYNTLGITYYEKRMYDKAIENYKKAISIDPQTAQFYDNLGVAYDMKGLYTEGINSHLKAIRYELGNIKAYKNLAAVYIRQGRYDEAVGVYTRAIYTIPGDAQLHYLLAAVYMKRNDVKSAVGEFDKYLTYEKDAIRTGEVKKLLRDISTAR
jgi:tetratricopeptide (TPR) repeat protein